MPDIADPVRFERAIEAFRDLVPVTDAEFAQLTREEQVYAFRVAGVTQANMVRDVFDSLDKAIEDGTTFDDFKDAMGDVLEDAWGRPDSPRLETIFRTNIMGAYNRGRMKMFLDPDVAEERPYLRAEVVNDDRTSPICRELIDVILPANDPFWRTHTPPLHHQCRTILTGLTEEEAIAAGVTVKKPRDAQPSNGFGDEPDEDKEGSDLFGIRLDDFPIQIRDTLQARLRSMRS